MEQKDSVAHEKWRRFLHNPIALISLVLLVAMYIVSLCANIICSSKPVYMKVDGKNFFPFMSYISESELFENGSSSEVDYEHLEYDERFYHNKANIILFAPFRHGPMEVMQADDFEKYRRIRITIRKNINVGRCDITRDFSIKKNAIECETFKEALSAITNKTAIDVVEAISMRFDNIESPKAVCTIGNCEVSLLDYKPRVQAPKTVRLRLKDVMVSAKTPKELTFEKIENTGYKPANGKSKRILKSFDTQTVTELKNCISNYISNNTNTVCNLKSIDATAELSMESVNWPHRPVKGHPMGIDNAGRDVFARVLFGMRTAMTFGLFLVVWSIIIGITAGALQGYFGGLIDLSAQRFIEIWSALPFLYVMILIGSVIGRSFILLLLCYGLFNWIGVSYYVRAEFLRIRKRQFIEAAKCQGLSNVRIITHHILPNALTPIITLFPFNLVGAITSISALDFLGFGLPPLTPSWGELLQQAQQNVSAWWLILYPSIMLFCVIILSVFIGEGLRDAFNPKPSARYR